MYNINLSLYLCCLNGKLLYLTVALVKLRWVFWKSNMKCRWFHIEFLKSQIFNDKINIVYVALVSRVGFLGEI